LKSSDTYRRKPRNKQYMELHNCFEQTTEVCYKITGPLGTHGYLCVNYTVTLNFCDEYSRRMQQIKSKVLVHLYYVPRYFHMFLMKRYNMSVVTAKKEFLKKKKTCSVEFHMTVRIFQFLNSIEKEIRRGKVTPLQARLWPRGG